MGAASAGGWFVYILCCTDGTFYTGITRDVGRRCRQHNEGTASRYTRSRRPVRLVYQERQADQSAALRREAAIKAMSHREKEAIVRRARRGRRAG
jgi:predicted GIY-YIG superfamily endonuclease